MLHFLHVRPQLLAVRASDAQGLVLPVINLYRSLQMLLQWRLIGLIKMDSALLYF